MRAEERLVRDAHGGGPRPRPATTTVHGVPSRPLMAATGPANPGSVTIATAPACRMMYSSSGSASRTLSGRNAAPTRFTASALSRNSGRLPISSATMSPWPTPAARKAAASAFTRSRSCRWVSRVSRKITAASSGVRSAFRSRDRARLNMTISFDRQLGIERHSSE